MDDLNALLVRAARGDHEAQSDMVIATLARAMEGKLSDEEAVTEAEVWGRMAATSCLLPYITQLAGVLVLKGALLEHLGLHEAATAPQAEAIGLLDLCATEGSEVAADTLNKVSWLVKSDAIALARATSRA